MTNTEITTAIIIPIVAAFCGGIVGAFIASRNQKKQIRHNDKKYILAQLMGNRHEGPTNEDFIKALNMVVVLFQDNRTVIENYHRYYSTSIGNVFQGGERITTLFELMRSMAVDLGFNLNNHDLNDFFVVVPPLPPAAGT
jgi:hypothetical protein